MQSRAVTIGEWLTFARDLHEFTLFSRFLRGRLSRDGDGSDTGMAPGRADDGGKSTGAFPLRPAHRPIACEAHLARRTEDRLRTPRSLLATG